MRDREHGTDQPIEARKGFRSFDDIAALFHLLGDFGEPEGLGVLPLVFEGIP
jgi:hypothetical protein